METRKRMPKRPRPEFPIPLSASRSEVIIDRLRRNKIAVSTYLWLADTLVPLVLAVVIVVPVGAVLLLFYIPKFCRNRKRRHEYGVTVVDQMASVITSRRG
jgi:hypothetical protein